MQEKETGWKMKRVGCRKYSKILKPTEISQEDIVEERIKKLPT